MPRAVVITWIPFTHTHPWIMLLPSVISFLISRDRCLAQLKKCVQVSKRHFVDTLQENMIVYDQLLCYEQNVIRPGGFAPKLLASSKDGFEVGTGVSACKPVKPAKAMNAKMLRMLLITFSGSCSLMADSVAVT